jgi:hypothetical protein
MTPFEEAFFERLVQALEVELSPIIALGPGVSVRHENHHAVWVDDGRPTVMRAWWGPTYLWVQSARSVATEINALICAVGATRQS